MPRRLAATAVLAVLALAAAFAFGGGSEARAQQPPSLPPQLEAQALQIERQLLCPQCTNKRLDVCELAICQDMKRLIRERLGAGERPDNILLFFSNRYGERVLAELPKSGFNLWLWGWVGGSIAAVAALGAAWLLTQCRQRPVEAAPPPEADDRWLDAQLREG